jgi:hypothetical protein
LLDIDLKNPDCVAWVVWQDKTKTIHEKGMISHEKKAHGLRGGGGYFQKTTTQERRQENSQDTRQDKI